MASIALPEDQQSSAGYLAQNNSIWILTVTGVFQFISLLIVLARLYVRGVMIRSLGYDDLCIGIAAVLGLGNWICFIGETKLGVGRHLAAIDPSDLHSMKYWGLPHNIIVLFAVMMVKVSVGLLLVRISGSFMNPRVIYIVIAFMCMYTTIDAGVLLGLCDQTAPRENCVPLAHWKLLDITNSVISMVTDAIFAVLPVYLLTRLRLNMRTKIALSFALSLGFVAVICGCIKTYYLWGFFQQKDRYYKWAYFVWAALELYVGIIAASLPMLRPLVAVLVAKAGTVSSRVTTTMARLWRNTYGCTARSLSTVADGLVHRKSIIDVENGSTCDGFGKSKAGLIISMDSVAPPLDTGRKIQGFSDRAKDPNCNVSTLCARSDSAPSLATNKSPVQSFLATSTIRSQTGARVPSMFTATSTSTSVGSGLAETNIMVTTKVVSTSEKRPPGPSCPSLAKAEPKTKRHIIPGGASAADCPITRTFEDLFRRNQIIPHKVAGEVVIQTLTSRRDSAPEWETMEGPAQYEADVEERLPLRADEDKITKMRHER